MGRQARDMAGGWEISDVERLVGLPRRFIQRACYTGKDGVGILAPKTNARERTYDIQDLATLFVVRLLRDEHYSPDRKRHTLGEVRDAIAQEGGDIARMLRAESELLRDELEEISDQYLRARALLAALDEGSAPKRLAELVDELETASSIARTESEVDPAVLPGIDLVRELCHARGVSLTNGTS